MDFNQLIALKQPEPNRSSNYFEIRSYTDFFVNAKKKQRKFF